MPYYVVLTEDESIKAQRGSADPDMYEIRTECPTTNSSHQQITNGWMGSYGDLSETALGEYETVEEARERVFQHAGGEDHLTDQPDQDSFRHQYWVGDDEEGTGVVERRWVRTDVAFGADGIIVDWDNGGVATGGPDRIEPLALLDATIGSVQPGWDAWKTDDWTIIEDRLRRIEAARLDEYDEYGDVGEDAEARRTAAEADDCDRYEGLADGVEVSDDAVEAELVQMGWTVYRIRSPRGENVLVVGVPPDDGHDAEGDDCAPDAGERPRRQASGDGRDGEYAN